MINNKDQDLLSELRSKTKLLPQEKAQLKNLERKEKASKKEEDKKTSDIKNRNVFAIKSTT